MSMTVEALSDLLRGDTRKNNDKGKKIADCFSMVKNREKQ